MVLACGLLLERATGIDPRIQLGKWVRSCAATALSLAAMACRAREAPFSSPLLGTEWARADPLVAISARWPCCDRYRTC